MIESTQEKKMEAYRKFGWSNNEILLLLFKASTTCMSLPIKKMVRAMEFLVNKMAGTRPQSLDFPSLRFTI